MSPEPDPGLSALGPSSASFSYLFLNIIANFIVERMRLGDIPVSPGLRVFGFYPVYLFPLPFFVYSLGAIRARREKVHRSCAV